MVSCWYVYLNPRTCPKANRTLFSFFLAFDSSFCCMNCIFLIKLYCSDLLPIAHLCCTLLSHLSVTTGQARGSRMIHWVNHKTTDYVFTHRRRKPTIDIYTTTEYFMLFGCFWPLHTCISAMYSNCIFSLDWMSVVSLVNIHICLPIYELVWEGAGTFLFTIEWPLLDAVAPSAAFLLWTPLWQQQQQYALVFLTNLYLFLILIKCAVAKSPISFIRMEQTVRAKC